MFEVLLVACLAAGAECRTDRIPGGPTLRDCRVTASAVAADIVPPRVMQEYPCVPAGGARPAMALSMIAPGVFVHKGHHAPDPDTANGGDLANLGFVIGDNAVAVIDTGTHPGVGAALLDAIRAETDLPVTHVILTHGHPDHVLGVRPFVDAGARVIAHANYPQALASRRAGYLANLARLGMTDLTERDVVLDVEPVGGRREIDLGNRVLVVTAHATAHTNNDLTVLDRSTGTLFLGDLLFVDHAPAVDGSLTGWIDVMNELAVPGADKAVPGHGPVEVVWPDGATALLRYLEAVAADTREAIADGVPMVEAINRIGAGERGHWLFFERFNPRNASAAIQELEWE